MSCRQYTYNIGRDQQRSAEEKEEINPNRRAQENSCGDIGGGEGICEHRDTFVRGVCRQESRPGVVVGLSLGSIHPSLLKASLVSCIFSAFFGPLSTVLAVFVHTLHVPVSLELAAGKVRGVLRLAEKRRSMDVFCPRFSPGLARVCGWAQAKVARFFRPR